MTDLPHAAWTMLVEWPLERSLPWTFPVDLGQEPLVLSTREDLAQIGPLAPVERRLVSPPVVRRALTDVLGGPERAEQVELQLRRRSDASLVPDLGDVTDTKELRGKLVTIWVADAAAATPVPRLLLNGTIATWTLTPAQCSLLVTALDASSMNDLVPNAIVTTRQFPYAAPASDAPAGGVGSAVTMGMGLGRRVPCRSLRRLVEADTFFEKPVELVVPADNVLLISDHDAETGQGPYRVVALPFPSGGGIVPGTLPGGLEAERQYWLIFVDEDRLALATSYANALAGIAVDITSVGTGGVRLRGGQPAQPLPEWDYAVEVGNVAIHRVYDSADPSPMVPGTDWIALRRVYRVQGVDVTAIRLLDDPATDPITADVLRLPDLDYRVAAEWQWTGDFRDALGGGADWLSATITTANLVPGPTGVGLGAIRFTSGLGFLEQTGGAETLWADILTFGGTIEILARSRRASSASGRFTLLQLARDAAGAQVSILLQDDRGPAAPRASIIHAGGIAVLAGTPGSWPNNQWVHLALTVMPTAASLFVNGQPVGTIALSPPIGTPAEPWTVRLGAASSVFVGDLGWVRVSRGARAAADLRENYYVLRRNPVIAARMFARATRHPIDDAQWLAIAGVIDGVEAGGLHTDCAVSDQSQLRDILAAFAPFRELRWYLDQVGRLTVNAAVAPGTPALILRDDGSGDIAISVENETIASATEAYRRLPVSFYGLRDENGTFQRYGVTLTRDVSPVGTLETPLELPFVDDPMTADIIADFRAKRLTRQERLRSAALGRDADALMPADVVGWDRRGIVEPWAVLSLDRAAASSEARLVPTSADDFVYTPAPLPALPVGGTTLLSALGNVSGLVATAESPRTIRVTPRLTQRTQIVPIQLREADGLLGVVGTTTSAVVAVQPVPPAQFDLNYIQQAATLPVFFRFSPLTLPVGMHGFTVSLVQMLASVRPTVSGSVGVFYLYRRPNTGDAHYALDADLVTMTAGVWTNLDAVASTPAADDTAVFTLPDFAAIDGAISSDHQLDITSLSLIVDVTLEAPAVGLGWVRYWTAPVGETEPLLETSPPVAASRDFGPVKFQVPTAGSWKVLGRVYDLDGRFVGNLGTATLTVPV